ncbi:tyrosyl-trna synthetase [Diplodia corticola]|uniref:tyrosine--tRNA ligase n=1 Tax=Diplodia corticola TaxID=236234 RepID=A0A1J9QQT1_9PEZI|nr:tyrosyl-trna synthetase [Diplodia corticola]OJD30386.1 tyrosyl-trna synthetase [Diplodia corticola]
MLPTEEKLRLVMRRQTLSEGETPADFEKLLSEKEKPNITWLTTPTGKPHVCYIVPLAKLVDFLRAGLDVKILILDVYGFLVNYKHPMELVAHRAEYYRRLVTAVLQSLGVPPGQVEFIDESSYVYSKKFMVDMQKLAALMTQQDARDTCEEISETTMLSPMLCCIHQSLSEEYVGMDIQFGGLDQTGLFEHARKFIPQLDYRQRLHAMNPIVAGLDGLKMSSSKPADTKIMFLDDPDTVRRKVQNAACQPREVAGNGVMELLKHVLMPIGEMQLERERGQTGFNDVERTQGSGRQFVSDGAPDDAVFSVVGPEEKVMHFTSYEEVEKAYVGGTVDPQPLKRAVAEAFNSVLAPILKIYQESKEWQEVDRLAYPDEWQEVKGAAL